MNPTPQIKLPNKITLMRRGFIITICLIWGYFLFGFALSETVSMRPGQDLGPLKLLGKLAEVHLGGFLLKTWPSLIVAVLLIPFARPKWHRFEKWSIGIALGGVIIPGLLLAPESSGLLFYLPILALSTLIEVVSGTAEGETYNEGFVCASAIGWWLIAWGAAASYKLYKLLEGDDDDSDKINVPDPEE